MGQSGINLENVKVNNRSTILRLLNNYGSISRKDIAKEVGLTPAAVTLLCTELIEEGILIEKGEVQEEGKVGRKKVLLDIDYTYKSVISVSIELKKTYIHICDLKGNVIKKKKRYTNKDISPEEYLNVIADECKELLSEAEMTEADILGIGICIPGIVNRKKGISLRAYGIWKQEVHIGEIIKQWFQCPVVVENNIKAYAEGELLYGRGRTGDDLLFVKWGPGVGSAIVIQNQIYEGREHRAAEIGHYIIEPEGKLCKCGRRGCLETRVSIESIVEKIKKLYSESYTPKLYQLTDGNVDNISEEVFTMWIEECEELPDQLRDDIIVNLLNQNIERFARAIVNVVTVLAPDYTVLFGSMLENAYVEKEFLSYCQKYDESYGKDYIGKSKLSKKIYHIGAAAIVTRQLLFEKGHG